MFPKIVSRAVQFADTMLLKILRLLSSHEVLRPRLLEVLNADKQGASTWMHELVVQTSATSATPELLVEAIGTLANFDCETPVVPWPDLCQAGLLDVLHNLFTPGFSDDDVLLECILLTGVLANDPETVPLLATSKVPTLFANLLTERRKDCEILVQVLFTLRCLLLQEGTCELLLQETDCPDHILELFQAASGMDAPSWRVVRALCEETLDLIIVADRQEDEALWAERIKRVRFEIHNEEWCRRLMNDERPQDLKSAASGATDTKGSFAGWTDTTGLADRCWGDMPTFNSTTQKSLS
jgi:hypothetical protein